MSKAKRETWRRKFLTALGLIKLFRDVIEPQVIIFFFKKIVKISVFVPKIYMSKFGVHVIHSTLHFTSLLPYELIGVVGALSTYELMLLLTVHRIAVLLFVFNLFLRNAGKFKLEVSCINS